MSLPVMNVGLGVWTSTLITVTKKEIIISRCLIEQNGPCVSCDRGFCKYGDFCKFEHVEVCFYQEDQPIYSQDWARDP